MGESSSRRKETRPENISPWTHALIRISTHRHLVLGCGLLLVIVAVWYGTHQSTRKSPPPEDDGLTELEGFDTPPESVAGIAEQTQPLILPPAPDDAPVDLRSAFANAEVSEPSTTVNAASFVSPSVEPPAWLTGTIESVEESSSPTAVSPQEAAMRYVRPAHRE